MDFRLYGEVWMTHAKWDSAKDDARVGTRPRTRSSLAIVAVSGVDGSGKTTLSQALAEALNELGVTTTVVYGRFAPKILRVIPRIFRKLRYPSQALDAYSIDYLGNREAIAGNRILRPILRLLVLAAYVVGMHRSVSSARKRYDMVVCDRYILDTWVLDLRLGSRVSLEKDLSILRLLRRVLPSPILSYLLDVTSDEASRRKQGLLPAPVLESVIREYRIGASHLGLATLNGSKPVADNLGRILEDLRAAQEA